MSIRRHRPMPPRGDHQHGIQTDSRGQDQPVDKSRAQQASVGEERPIEKAQRDADVRPNWGRRSG
jgi:hypothetical protein